MSDLQAVAREWLRARNIVAAFLAELRPNAPREHHEFDAATILARLASADPPILLHSPDTEDIPGEDA